MRKQMKKQMRRNMLFTTFLFILLFTVGACKKDTPEELKQDNDLVQKANQLLSGDIVLSTIAKMGNVDKTLLPEGCPTKYYFEWLEDEKKLLVRLPRFQVGNMPFAVAFKAKTTYSEVSYFKKKEYPPEDGWIQFSASDGNTYAYQTGETEPPIPDGASIIEGFVNPNTGEMEMLINYNVMLVTSFCFKQKIDKSRLKTYEEDFKQYEKDLKKYKEEHGID